MVAAEPGGDYGVASELSGIIGLIGLLVLAWQPPAFAHSGGLNRYGCHNETATGGYHCHRDSDNQDDDTDWKTIGYVVGGLVGLVLLTQALTPKMSTLSLIEADQTRWKRIEFRPFGTSNTDYGIKVFFEVRF